MQICQKSRRRGPRRKRVAHVRTYLGGNGVRSQQHAIRNDGAQLAVDVLQLLRQLRNGVHVVGFHHGIGGVQLLHVGIVRVHVHGQRGRRWALPVRYVALFVIYAGLEEQSGDVN